MHCDGNTQGGTSLPCLNLLYSCSEISHIFLYRFFAPYQAEVLFIGNQFSNLSTAVDTVQSPPNLAIKDVKYLVA
jgi:hypothetical protein